MKIIFFIFFVKLLKFLFELAPKIALEFFACQFCDLNGLIHDLLLIVCKKHVSVDVAARCSLCQGRARTERARAICPIDFAKSQKHDHMFTFAKLFCHMDLFHFHSGGPRQFRVVTLIASMRDFLTRYI
jgi:hypothetical protein